MDSKATPGPWYAEPPFNDGKQIEPWRIMSNGMIICSDIWGMGPEEDAANAALMAQAPDLLEQRDELLEALQLMMDAFDNQQTRLTFIIGAAQHLYDDLMRTSRAAIANATKETENES